MLISCLLFSSIHHQKPLILTCSGQRYYQEKIDNDSEEEAEKTEENTSIENSIKLWWVGNEKPVEEPEKISQDGMGPN